jgi:integrase
MHVRKYKKKWQTIVRRKGHKTKIKSFVSKAEATKWGRSIERNLDTGSPVDYSEASKNTLGDLFKRYIRENKHKAKKQWRNEEYRVGQLLNDTISDINLLRFSTKHLAEFRNRRLESVKSATYNKDFNFISVVISTAINDWGIYLPHNPCKMMKRESEPKPRKRVLENDEQTRLIEACALSENIYLKPMVQFSIETAIRQGELLKIKYEHINFKKRLVTLYDTKNGEDRTIPLSQKAFTILCSLPRQFNGRMFPMTRDSLKFWWKQACRRAKIKGLRWHDLRRHAISVMFEVKGLDVPTVQLISGHKNPMVLLNTYTKLNPEKLVAKLG